MASPASDRHPLRRPIPLAIAAALLGAVLVGVALVDVTVVDPRITIRWGEDISVAHRQMLERRYELGNPAFQEGTTWRYELGDRSRENISALVQDPAVQDTGYIDRDHLTAESSRLRVTVRPVPYPFSDRFEHPSALLQLNSSLWLLLAGGVLLWAARASDERRRRNVTIATLLLVCALAWAFPISPSLVRMGDANQSVRSRDDWERYAGVRQIRFEAHLSYAILGQLDRLFGSTNGSPERAQITLARLITLWFVLCAVAIGVLERRSPMILRYLGLALLAPSALLYFGWREVGYMSLNVAAFPLLARGVRHGDRKLEAGSALCGLGTALHGFALVGLVGAWMAALAAPAPLAARMARLLRVAAWGTAAYVGWTAVYMIVLKMPVTVGHAEYFPWRPWLADEILERRVNAALFSATGARDLLMTGCIVGAPLLVAAGSLWRRYGNELRTALAYALPSVIFTIIIWPVQGLAEEMDLIVCRFPAIYALAWVCAHDEARTKIAAVLLASAHYVFWRVLLDGRFINPALF